MRLSDFGEGDVYMVGAVVGFYLAEWLARGALPVWLMLVVVLAGATVSCGILGYCIERFAYRPLRSRPRLVLLITAIGVSLLLENGFQLPQLFGATPRHYPQATTPALLTPIRILGLTALAPLSPGL